jgi:hypothetical protein
MKVFLSFLIVMLSTSACFCQTRIQLDEPLDASNGFVTPELTAMAQQALIIFDTIINSNDFREQFLEKGFVRKQRYSTKEIYQLIHSGVEYETQPDNVINLKMQVYPEYNGGSEVGKTVNGIIMTYAGYIRENGVGCYAAHLIHEYCHVVGFSHAFLRMPLRNRTVPYRAGEIAEKILKISCP